MHVPVSVMASLCLQVAHEIIMYSPLKTMYMGSLIFSVQLYLFTFTRRNMKKVTYQQGERGQQVIGPVSKVCCNKFLL